MKGGRLTTASSSMEAFWKVTFESSRPEVDTENIQSEVVPGAPGALRQEPCPQRPMGGDVVDLIICLDPTAKKGTIK